MNAALLFALVSASLKQEFESAVISQGTSYLHQPILAVKVQKDPQGSVRGYLKDIHEGKLSYSKVDFSPAGVLISQEIESTSSGAAFKTIGYRQVADYFIDKADVSVGGVDTMLYSQRLTHEGRRLQRSLNEVLEVYKFSRACGDKLCLSVMRREPSRVEGGKASMKVLEHARSYDIAEKDAGLQEIQKNFAHSDEKKSENSVQQFWKYCFGDYCTLNEKVAKTVRVVRKAKGSVATESVTGDHVYKFYKKNANKAEVVDFEILNKECASESELPSPGNNVTFSKCGDIVKMQIGEYTYLMKDAAGKLSEATNAPTKFGESLPADENANKDFSAGVQKVEAIATGLAVNGGEITEPVYADSSVLASVCIALLF